MRTKPSDFTGGPGGHGDRSPSRTPFPPFPPVQKICSIALALALAHSLGAAQPAPLEPSDTDALFETGRRLFELFAPPEIKAQYDFPTKERWDALVAKFKRALEGDSVEELADCAREGRQALEALRLVPGYEDLADWLEQRIDSFEGAKQTLAPKPPAPPVPPPQVYEPVPHYHLWLARVQSRPAPARAAALMPRLRAAFASEGVPPELAWLAEAESSFNPAARSPVGAKGLFQFMPDTAKAMGLSTFLPDDRTDPEKSARAAARYLRQLHGRFGNWALVLAAYNAGEGRVGRTLAQHKATSFTAIAEKLPAETRMYVPKVCALIATRAGVAPERIGPPKPAAR
ncbi:MAG: lytic transglycosylase domain-containing protein [Opitutaceae bacterium]|nr:lytic transglycosylase domain-containing protein [Opitutaceae bacterium]